MPQKLAKNLEIRFFRGVYWVKPAYQTTLFEAIIKRRLVKVGEDSSEYARERIILLEGYTIHE